MSEQNDNIPNAEDPAASDATLDVTWVKEHLTEIHSLQDNSRLILEVSTLAERVAALAAQGTRPPAPAAATAIAEPAVTMARPPTPAATPDSSTAPPPVEDKTGAEKTAPVDEEKHVLPDGFNDLLGRGVAELKTRKTYLRDLTERVLSTFVQGFVGGIATTAPLDGSMWYAALGGGTSAVLSLLKGLMARGRGDSNSASLSHTV